MKYLAQVLEMIFRTGQDRNYRITLDDPRSDLEASEVKGFMELVVGMNPFDVEGGLVNIAEANIITTQVEPLDLN